MKLQKPARKKKPDRIFLLSGDVFLENRLREALAISGGYMLFFSEDMIPPCSWDIAILPAESADRWMPLISRYPVILTGPAELVNIAYATGCIDYLREEWTTEELVFRLDRYFSGVRKQMNVTLAPKLSKLLNFQERMILEYLLSSRGTECYRGSLQLHLWGEERPESRAIDMHIANIRKKIETIPGMAKRLHIKTVTGCGYLVDK